MSSGILALAAPLLGPRVDAQGADEGSHGAGLVVQHEDGRVIYVYVSFSEEQITGADLLARSGLNLAITPYSGLGQGVCTIDHEGCPLTNCFCQSYASPARYWRYFRLNPDGQWASLPIGPSSRKIMDGDVDGWVWGPSDQPPAPTSIETIAQINGIGTAAQGTVAPVSTPQDGLAAQSSPTNQVAEAAPQEAPSPVSDARAVQVDPSGEITSVDTNNVSGVGPDRSYLAFAAIATVAALLGVWVAIVRRRSPQ